MEPDTLHNLRHALRLTVAGIAAALLIVTVAAWSAPLDARPLLWAVRIAAPLAAVVFAAAALYMAPPPAAAVPDLLARVSPVCFERGGLAFAPKFVTDGGSCYFCVYFQNRFRGHATARIDIRAPRGWLDLRAPSLADVSVALDVPGGAFGVAWMHYAVPKAEQGRHAVYHVAASTDYPQGRGEQLSSCRGRRVGPAGSRGARAWMLLPTGVPEVGPGHVEVHTSILWQPDLPTGGFPVLPVTSAA